MSGRPMPDNSEDNPDGDNAPGYSHKRPAYRPDEQRVRRPTGPVVPYAELHCHSNFSFLDGVSDPEELIEEGVRLGLDALAITDHDGFYAASRFAEAALAYDLRTIYGAELSLGLSTPQNGVADPEGQHLLVLARGVEGYHRLAGAITEAQLRGDEKGRPSYREEELAAQANGNWMILTGCRKGAVRQALITSGRTAGVTMYSAPAMRADRQDSASSTLPAPMTIWSPSARLVSRMIFCNGLPDRFARIS